MNIERMKKTSHFFSVVSLLITVALLIAVIAIIAVGIAVALNDSLWPSILNEVEGQSIVKDDIYVMVAMACMVLPVVTAMFFLSYRLFSNIGRSHTPFTTDNVKILKWISYLILVLAIPVSIAVALMAQTFSSWTDDAVIGWNGIPLILLAVMFYFMAHIFEYGTALQKESDETL
jgi:hypothetical protein